METALRKLSAIIISCTTLDHLIAARRYFYLIERQYGNIDPCLRSDVERLMNRTYSKITVEV